MLQERAWVTSNGSPHTHTHTHARTHTHTHTHADGRRLGCHPYRRARPSHTNDAAAPPIRHARNAHGVAIWVKSNMAFQHLDRFSTEHHEVIWISASTSSWSRIVICALYWSTALGPEKKWRERDITWKELYALAGSRHLGPCLGKAPYPSSLR